jgi:hypothetical protein
VPPHPIRDVILAKRHRSIIMIIDSSYATRDGLDQLSALPVHVRAGEENPWRRINPNEVLVKGIGDLIGQGQNDREAPAQEEYLHWCHGIHCLVGANRQATAAVAAIHELVGLVRPSDLLGFDHQARHGSLRIEPRPSRGAVTP